MGFPVQTKQTFRKHVDQFAARTGSKKGVTPVRGMLMVLNEMVKDYYNGDKLILKSDTEVKTVDLATLVKELQQSAKYEEAIQAEPLHVILNESQMAELQDLKVFLEKTTGQTLPDGAVLAIGGLLMEELLDGKLCSSADTGQTFTIKVLTERKVRERTVAY